MCYTGDVFLLSCLSRFPYDILRLIFQARESSEEDWDSGESPKKKKRKEKKKEKKKHQAIKVGRRRRHSSEEDGPSTSRPSRTARTKKASYGRLRYKLIFLPGAVVIN